MRKIFITLIFSLILIIPPSLIYAGSIDYNSNQSAKFFMNPAKTACTDGADIVAYNPAGTVFMKSGLYFDVSEQFIMRKYEQDVSRGTLSDDTYTQDKPAFIYPNLFIVYNFGRVGSGKLAIYGHAGIIGGGGSVDWDGTAAFDNTAFAMANLYFLYLGSTCNPTSINNRIQASSLYLGLGAGVAYSFFRDKVSISIGGRFVHSERDVQIDGELEYDNGYYQTFNTEWDYNADNFSHIIGIDIRPMRKVTIGIRYEAKTSLLFKYEQDENVAYNNQGNTASLNDPLTNSFNKDGDKKNQDLPEIFSIGVEYAFSHKLAVSVSGTTYSLSKTDMEGLEECYGTGWDASIGVAYKINRRTKIGAGFIYTDTGAKDSFLEDGNMLSKYSINPPLNSMTYGLGITYSLWKDFDITLSGAYIYYIPEDTTVTGMSGTEFEVGYRKNAIAIATGVSYKL